MSENFNEDKNIFEYIQNETDLDSLKSNLAKFIENFVSSQESLIQQQDNILTRMMFLELVQNSVDISKDFPVCEKPKVSIVIPVKNECHLTNIVLNTIWQHTEGIDYEVIIADDNSDDETVNIETKFRNVKRIVNDSGTSGFIYNVTNAIKHAKGEYIFLMNNDMIATEGYLKGLLDVLERDPSVGIAGSKNLNVDSTILESGIMLDSEGLVHLINSDLPNDAGDEFECIECDYCSGCSILFRRESWDKLDGFDFNYAPAYYEDSDFALRMKYELGLKTVCVPKSKIYHFKGCTYEKKGVMHDSSENRSYFLSKWKKYLKNFG